jgi:hypothetical protein
MDPNAIIALALTALNAVLQVIAEVRGQGGLTDDQIADQVKTITAGNDAAYFKMMEALKLQTAPPVTPPQV